MVTSKRAVNATGEYNAYVGISNDHNERSGGHVSTQEACLLLFMDFVAFLERRLFPLSYVSAANERGNLSAAPFSRRVLRSNDVPSLA